VINGLGTGGAERSLAEMLPHFLEADIQPIIAAFYRRREGVERELLEQGVDVRFVLTQSLPSRVRALRRIIAAERPHLIHTTLFEADLSGRLAAVRSKSPVLSSLVNTSYNPIRLKDPNVRAIKLWGAKLIDGWTARHLTTHFHAITYAVKEAAMEALGLPAERITVIERGRDSARLGRPSQGRRRRARAQLGLGEKDQVLVNVGRQEYQKGQRYLLEAMGQLVSYHPRLVLLVVGRKGHASPELARIHQQIGLGDKVRFLGHRDDVPEVLAAADLFVFPSLYEGLGCAVIEAMALGLPIVASDLPVLREVVQEGHNALLVEPASSSNIAQGIDTLLKERSLASDFGRRGREIFEERFTIERITSRMVELYARIIRSGQ
jgi:glycosyltransferase involved in cell wall biosynthesis